MRTTWWIDISSGCASRRGAPPTTSRAAMDGLSTERAPVTVIGNSAHSTAPARADSTGTRPHGEDFADTFEAPGGMPGVRTSRAGFVRRAERFKLRGGGAALLLGPSAVGSPEGIVPHEPGWRKRMVHKAGFHPTACSARSAPRRLSAGVSSCAGICVDAHGDSPAAWTSGIIRISRRRLRDKRLNPGWAGRPGLCARRPAASQNFKGHARC